MDTARTVSRRRCQRSADLAAYMPLVRRIAGRIGRRVPANVEMDDLMQAGLIALNEALSRFEKGPGSTFETYAARRIEGAMLDSLRADDLLSRDARAQVRQVRAAVQRLEHRLGRAPRAKEVANELGWPLDRLHRCMQDAGLGACRASDTELEHVEDPPYYGRTDNEAVMTRSDDPARALEQRQRHAVLSAAFDALEEVERWVMESIYDKERPLREIGEDLGVTEGRVSQIRSEIVEKLRRRLHGT